MPRRVLFLAKADHAGAASAEHRLRRRFDVRSAFGRWGDPMSETVLTWRGDIIISYLAPWIVPARLLDAAESFAINFHPGPPEYPGIGCTNFALYNVEHRFGVTCHHMALPVDSGPIVRVRRFDIVPDETVHSLTVKCHEEIGLLFDEVISHIELDQVLPASAETWTRRAFRRDDLNDLCRISANMDPAEIRRRVRATAYPGMPGAFVELGGLRFEYGGNPLDPVAVD